MSRVRSDLVRALLALLIAFVVTTAAVSFLFSRGFVVGDFMAPALLDGDAIVVDRASGRFIDYRPGEIVSLQIPGEPSQAAGVLRGHQVHGGQHVQRALADVPEIADGGGDNIQSRFHFWPLPL